MDVRADVELPPEHLRLLGYRNAGGCLAASCRHGRCAEGASEVSELRLTRKYGCRSIQLTTILELSGICSFRRREKAGHKEKKKMIVII